MLSPDHPETLRAAANVARWTGHAGDPGKARDQLTDLLPVSERVLGPEHPDTQAVRHELAHWTGLAEEAEPLAPPPGRVDVYPALDER